MRAFVSCFSLLLLWDKPASSAWAPSARRLTCGGGRSCRSSSILSVASREVFSDTRWEYDSRDDKMLSDIEADIETQWKSLRNLNGGTVVKRATFSIPREVPRGTHSIETAYGIDKAQGTEEEMTAAMDLIVRGETFPRRYNYGGLLSLVLDGASMILSETMAGLEVPNADDERGSKIKSFQGVLKLGREFFDSFLSMVAHKPVDKEKGIERPPTYSATLFVVDPSTTFAPVQPAKNPTISLSPVEASKVWGYEAKGEGKWRKTKVIGLWKDRVVQSKAATTNNLVEQVVSGTNGLVQGVASACDKAANATFQFQKSITTYFEQAEKAKRRSFTMTPAGKSKDHFFFAKSSGTSSNNNGGEAFYFMAENGLF